jgi:hypothetical protein
MRATCPACDRPLGALARRCPYCGERSAGDRRRRRAARLLAATALLALAWALSRACGAGAAAGANPAGALAVPRAAVSLAMAVMLISLPLVCRPALPGAAGAEGLGQTLRDAAVSLGFGSGLLLGAWLAGLPAARVAAGLALLALAPLPWLLRRPAYPLLAVPLVVLAWRLAAS